MKAGLRDVPGGEASRYGLVRTVPGEGPLDAELMLVGEAGGEEEARQGRPFVGPTGMVVEELLRGIGVKRARVRIDNVVQRRPYVRNVLKSIPQPELFQWKLDLLHRMDAVRPKVVVAFGALALEALTGKKGIERWRGSIMPFKAADYGCWVVPMWHPAMVFKNPLVRRALDNDMQRVRGLLDGSLKRPRRRYRICPSIEEVELYASLVCRLGDADVLTLDIETPGHLACVGFSYDPHEAMCVPTTRAYWKDSHTLGRAWRAVRAMCESNVPKVLMHGFYDTYWLRRAANIEVTNYAWDVMCMHHALEPLEDHNLAYICSMHTPWYRFWKTEAKDPVEVAKYAKSIEALYTYNAMDCCEQRAVYDALHARLVERNLVEFYAWHYRKLIPHMLDLMCTGFRVNTHERARRAARAKATCIRIEGELATIAGERVHAKTSFSRLAIEKLVYGTLKCPKRYNPETGSLTTDVFTVQMLMHRYPKKMGTVGPLILQHRKEERAAQFLDPEKVDHDGRLRSSYGFDPLTGRFSSSPNPMGTGDNAQNQDRRVRDTFVADLGCVLLKVDLSQAESRIVDMLTGHPWHVERARAKPWERDVHRETAAIVFKCSEKEVTKDQRYLSKRAKYAGCYDITAVELSRQLTKEAIFIEPRECQRMIDKAIEGPIREWQRRVRGQVMQQRVVGNSWGWTVDFHGLRLDRETYKRAYALGPQSEIAFWMHHWGFWPLADAIKARRFRAALNAHVHDELVVSVGPEDVYRVMVFLRDRLERSRRVSPAGMLTVPCTWGLGKTWKSEVEWDRFPSEAEVQAWVAERSW